MITVVHHIFYEDDKTRQRDTQTVDINPAMIIAIVHIVKRKSSWINGKWEHVDEKFRKVICRDNMHYVVTVKDARRLGGS